MVIIENWNSPITIVNPFQLFLERKYVPFQSYHLAGLIELLYRNPFKLRRINYLIFNVNRTRHKFSIKIHFSRYFERCLVLSFFLSFFLSRIESSGTLHREYRASGSSIFSTSTLLCPSEWIGVLMAEPWVRKH